MSAEHAPITPIREAARVKEQSDGDLVAERASLKADVEHINDRIAQIDAQLIDRLGVGTHSVDGTKVEIREYSRMNNAALEAAYPAAQYPDLYTTKTALNSDAVKRQFAPAALEQFKTRGAKSVVIK